MAAIAAQKKALLASSGPLPSGSAYKIIDKDTVRQCFYQTTAMRVNTWKQSTQDDRGENYLAVHTIGQKTSKYLDVQLSTAPLLDRTATTHSRVNVPLPLGDNQVNKALAKVYKEGFGSAMKGLDVAQNGRTQYDDDFPDVGEEAFAKRIGPANQPNQKPKQELTNTVGATDTLYEKKSHYHNRFVQPNLALARTERAAQPKPGLALGGAAKGVVGRTHFTREFTSPTAAVAARMMMSNSTPSLVDPAVLDSLTSDPAVFAIKRIPNMAPGK